MNSVADGDDDQRRRQLGNAVKQALREVNIQLTVLNRRCGGRVELKDVDLTCLDLINRRGPMTPTVLARRAGVHPATLTGILDRLQRAGWVVRERDAESTDRRAVTVRARKDRNQELLQVFSGMNDRMDEVCARYRPAELEVIADFLRRTADAGHSSAQELA